jgi:hypothetical protein
MFGSAELLLCGLAQMTELFSAEHRTFFILHYESKNILAILLDLVSNVKIWVQVNLPFLNSLNYKDLADF